MRAKPAMHEGEVVNLSNSDGFTHQELLTDKKIDQLLTQIGRLSDATRTEFDLVTARVGWFLTSEAFLCASFVAAAVNYPAKRHGLQTSFGYLLLALPVLGMALALLVGIAVSVAHKAAAARKDDRDAMMKRLPEVFASVVHALLTALIAH
jgi:hypothetical protein